MSAENLLPRIADGDGEAVTECIDRYGALVWSVARSFLSDDSQAEDAVQDVFIDLWKSAARFDASVSSETTFVATIARRRMIDRVRRTARSRETEVVEEASLVGADEGLVSLETCEEAARAADALRELDPDKRRLMELWILRGMSHRQIADSTGMPLGTVKSSLRRGLARVREVLDGTGAGEVQA